MVSWNDTNLFFRKCDPIPVVVDSGATSKMTISFAKVQFVSSDPQSPSTSIAGRAQNWPHWMQAKPEHLIGRKGWVYVKLYKRGFLLRTWFERCCFTRIFVVHIGFDLFSHMCFCGFDELEISRFVCPDFFSFRREFIQIRPLTSTAFIFIESRCKV